MRPTNLKQLRAIYDNTRFSFWNAGRRGGKTKGLEEDIKHHIPIWLSEMPPDSDMVYIGPTNQMAMELIWDKLEYAFWKMKWPCNPLVSKQRFEFPKRRNFYVIGAEKSRRVRGKKLFRAYMDEVAYFSVDPLKVWEKDVRPALSDLRGGGRAATTPDGKGSQAHEFYRNILKKENWSYHHWYTLDNPSISRDEIEEARAELDEKSFRQEYQATWESYEGLAYYNFDEAIHVKRQEPIDDNVPVILHFDFNVNPTTLIVAQRYPNMYSFKKEYSFKNSSTERTIEAFCSDYKHKAGAWELKIRGDASGNNRSSNTGYADYYYIENKLKTEGFRFKKEVTGANPAIVDRVRHVNSYLKNTLGQHRIEFDPSMSDTIKDFDGQELDGRHPSDKNNLGHKADAVGYGVYWDWIKTREDRKTETIYL